LKPAAHSANTRTPLTSCSAASRSRAFTESLHHFSCAVALVQLGAATSSFHYSVSAVRGICRVRLRHTSHLIASRQKFRRQLISGSLLEVVAVEISPFLVEPFNRSLSTGEFPDAFKIALMTSLMTSVVKKPGVDVKNPRSYRLVSNILVACKLLERVVALQLNRYVESAGLLLTLGFLYIPASSLTVSPLD
jgi:hypothetical protein